MWRVRLGLQKTVESPQLQFIEGRRHPCLYAEAISHGPDCCRTKEIHQFADMVADFPDVRVVQVLRCRCGEDFVLPRCRC